MSDAERAQLMERMSNVPEICAEVHYKREGKPDPDYDGSHMGCSMLPDWEKLADVCVAFAAEQTAQLRLELKEEVGAVHGLHAALDAIGEQTAALRALVEVELNHHRSVQHKPDHTCSWCEKAEAALRWPLPALAAPEGQP